VPLPSPELGLIVYYSYVFRRKTRLIGDAGKNRPCVIASVFAAPEDPLRTGVLYLPITHSAPGPEDFGILLTAKVKYAAGLDGAPQWLIASEGNKDIWPEDLAHFPNRPGVFHCGFLPPTILREAQNTVGTLYAERKFNIIRRNTPTPDR